MIGGMSGSEQFAITIKQYNETYNGEVPDKIVRDYINIYAAKSESKEKLEKGEKLDKIEEILS